MRDQKATATDNSYQRLMGASLLVFKNKSDVSGSMSEQEIREVRICPHQGGPSRA